MTASDIPEKGTIIDVEEIDDLLDELSEEDHSKLVGCFLRWHNEEVYPFELLDDGRLGARITLSCARCEKEGPTHYLTSGLHSGAWCYLCDKAGNYLANLRDEEYVCEECATKQKGEA